MSLIKNLIQEPEKPKKLKNGDDVEIDEEKEMKTRPIIKSAVDLQRLKLEKLMRNPEKPIIIPEARKEKDYMQTVPSFVRNVMGSSAGAGSGEFHVYRHLRRKEYARQKTIQAKSVKEKLDEDYQQQLEENRQVAEQKTAKKRAKRLKKKQRAKRQRQQLSCSVAIEKGQQSQNSDSDESENDQQNASEKTETSEKQAEIDLELDEKQTTSEKKAETKVASDLRKDTPSEKEINIEVKLHRKQITFEEKGPATESEHQQATSEKTETLKEQNEIEVDDKQPTSEKEAETEAVPEGKDNFLEEEAKLDMELNRKPTALEEEPETGAGPNEKQQLLQGKKKHIKI